MLAFGWNQSLEGAVVDWRLAAQNTIFVYLGADSAYQAQAKAAAAEGLLVGPYWTLESDLDPQGQAHLFLSRAGELARDQLPPAVFVKEGRTLATVKAFVEVVEQETKRRVLIGGTPKSLKNMGLVFGRTNPLWISHAPAWGGPSLPSGWERFALWQTPPPRALKGVSREVGYNVAADTFIKTGVPFAAELFAVVALGAVIYYAGTKHSGRS